MSHSGHSISLYIAKHTRFVPKINKLLAPYQNRARKTLKLRHPIRIEGTRISSQSKLSMTSAESSRLGLKPLFGFRVLSARYSLSLYIESSTFPHQLSSHNYYSCTSCLSNVKSGYKLFDNKLSKIGEMANAGKMCKIYSLKSSKPRGKTCSFFPKTSVSRNSITFFAKFSKIVFVYRMKLFST